MSEQRILTTHVGSLIRPDDLIAYLRKIHHRPELIYVMFQVVPGLTGCRCRPQAGGGRDRHRLRR